MSIGYLTPKAVAAYLSVTERTVLNLISDGKLQAIRVGRIWRIRKDWLEHFERGARSERGVRRARSGSKLRGMRKALHASCQPAPEVSAP